MSGLLDAVEAAITVHHSTNPTYMKRDQARAAVEAVAAWLDENGGEWCADKLRVEVAL